MAAAIPGDGLPHIPGVSSMAELLDDIYASRYVTFATFSLLLYDHALTLGDEIHLVWQSRSVNLVKILFVFNRYAVPACLAVDVAFLSGMVSGLTQATCHTWFMIDLVVEVLSLYSTTYIITLRIRALWTDNREVNTLLQTVWGSSVLATTGLLVFSTIKNEASYTLVPLLNICSGNIVDTWLIWIPAMLFHMVMFALLILKALVTPRQAHTKLMSILLLDGLIFFAVVFGAMFMNMMIWAFASPALAQLPHYSVWAISTLAITRLLLSLQRRYHHTGSQGPPAPEGAAQLTPHGMGPPPVPEFQKSVESAGYLESGGEVIDIRKGMDMELQTKMTTAVPTQTDGPRLVRPRGMSQSSRMVASGSTMYSTGEPLRRSITDIGGSGSDRRPPSRQTTYSADSRSGGMERWGNGSAASRRPTDGNVLSRAIGGLVARTRRLFVHAFSTGANSATNISAYPEDLNSRRASAIGKGNDVQMEVRVRPESVYFVDDSGIIHKSSYPMSTYPSSRPPSIRHSMHSSFPPPPLPSQPVPLRHMRSAPMATISHAGLSSQQSLSSFNPLVERAFHPAFPSRPPSAFRSGNDRRYEGTSTDVAPARDSSSGANWEQPRKGRSRWSKPLPQVPPTG